MSHPVDREVLAHRFVRWRVQAERCHRLLGDLLASCEVIDEPGDGTITLRVPFPLWRAVRNEALQPGPEPVDTPPTT